MIAVLFFKVFIIFVFGLLLPDNYIMFYGGVTT